MFLHSIVLLVTVLFSTQLFAKAEFLLIKDEAWKMETLATMDWVNKQLPQSWQWPQDFKIAYIANTDPRYYPVFHYKTADGDTKEINKLLVLGNNNRATFIHEYAHLVFDQLLRDQSKPWQYFSAWKSINFSDLNETIESYVELIKSLKKTNDEYLEKKKQGETDKFIDNVIRRTANSMIKYKDLLVQLENAKKIAQAYPYPLDQFNSFKALRPFNELFADSLAVLLLKNWSLMKETTLYDIAHNNLADKLALPPYEDKDEAIAVYASHRDFVKNLSVDTYNFQEWQNKSSYTQMAPIRSLIRKQVEENNIGSTQMIQALAESIISIYENELIPQPNNVDRNLLEKNKSLEKALLEHL